MVRMTPEIPDAANTLPKRNIKILPSAAIAKASNAMPALVSEYETYRGHRRTSPLNRRRTYCLGILEWA